VLLASCKKHRLGEYQESEHSDEHNYSTSDGASKTYDESVYVKESPLMIVSRQLCLQHVAIEVEEKNDINVKEEQ
jgi:hypothetical protein